MRNGNRTRITHPSATIPGRPEIGFITPWYASIYDGLDRLKSVANSGGNSIGVWTYDLSGRLETQVRNTAPATLYTYDAASRPLAVAHDLAGTAYDLTLGFAYNPAGQIATRSKSNSVYSRVDPNSYIIARPGMTGGAA